MCYREASLHSKQNIAHVSICFLKNTNLLCLMTTSILYFLDFDMTFCEGIVVAAKPTYELGY